MTQEELAQNAQQGDLEALSLLWEEVRLLLFWMAWKFYQRQGKDRCAHHGVTLEDLRQEAFLALANAVRSYKPERPIPFSGYLNRWAENRFRACMGIKPRQDPLNCGESLEASVVTEQGEGTKSLGELLPDPEAEKKLLDVDNLAAWGYAHQALEKALGELSPIQEAILRRRFFYRDSRPQTAQALHITENDVRREEAKALRALRGNPNLWKRKQEILEAAAYQGTGWYSWYYDGASVEERLAESRLVGG